MITFEIKRMKTFKEWIVENHPEVIEEINRFGGIAGLAGMGAMALSGLFPQAAQAEQPTNPNKPAATATQQQGNPDVTVKNGFVYARGVAPSERVAEVKAEANMSKFFNGQTVSREGNKVTTQTNGRIPGFKVHSTKQLEGGKFEVIIKSSMQ